MDFIEAKGLHRSNGGGAKMRVKATGGGAYKYAEVSAAAQPSGLSSGGHAAFVFMVFWWAGLLLWQLYGGACAAISGWI